MIFDVYYYETMVHCFGVEADSKEEAEEIAKEMVSDSELDFSEGEVCDMSFDVSEA